MYVLKRKWLWGAGVVVMALVAWNWRGVMLVSAIILSERRPALLSDAHWNDPASARAFNERFRPGTPESALIAWLEANKFTINRSMGLAGRGVQGLPCNEGINVDWTTTSDGKIGTIEVRVSEAGCL